MTPYPLAAASDGPLTVGRRYRVECLYTKVGRRQLWLPVLCSHVGDIGGEFHYHFDARFLSEYVFRLFGLSPDIGFGGTRQPEGRVKLKVMTCRRQFQTLRAANKPEHFYTLQEKMRGRRARTNCWTCPHQGVNLKQVPVTNSPQGPVRACPAHGLMWRVSDGTLVPRSMEKCD